MFYRTDLTKIDNKQSDVGSFETTPKAVSEIDNVTEVGFIFGFTTWLSTGNMHTILNICDTLSCIDTLFTNVSFVLQENLNFGEGFRINGNGGVQPDESIYALSPLKLISLS